MAVELNPSALSLWVGVHSHSMHTLHAHDAPLTTYTHTHAHTHIVTTTHPHLLYKAIFCLCYVTFLMDKSGPLNMMSTIWLESTHTHTHTHHS